MLLPPEHSRDHKTSYNKPTRILLRILRSDACNWGSKMAAVLMYVTMFSAAIYLSCVATAAVTSQTTVAMEAMTSQVSGRNEDLTSQESESSDVTRVGSIAVEPTSSDVGSTANDLTYDVTNSLVTSQEIHAVTEEIPTGEQGGVTHGNNSGGNKVLLNDAPDIQEILDNIELLMHINNSESNISCNGVDISSIRANLQQLRNKILEQGNVSIIHGNNTARNTSVNNVTGKPISNNVPNTAITMTDFDNMTFAPYQEITVRNITWPEVNFTYQTLDNEDQTISSYQHLEYLNTEMQRLANETSKFHFAITEAIDTQQNGIIQLVNNINTQYPRIDFRKKKKVPTATLR